MHYILIDDNNDALDLISQQAGKARTRLGITKLTLVWPNTLAAANLEQLAPTIEHLNSCGLPTTSEQIQSVKALAARIDALASRENEPTVLISDVNMNNIGLLTTNEKNAWADGGSDLRVAITRFLATSSNILFLHSGSGNKERIVDDLGGTSSRVFSLKSNMEHKAGSAEAKKIVEEIEALLRRRAGNRLERIWHDPRTKDWFTKRNVVPHEVSDIADLKAYKSAISAVWEVALPDSWFEGQNLAVFHESVKGLCGAYFCGRCVEPSESVSPDKGLRVGSVVLIAMLAFYEKAKTLGAFSCFSWERLVQTAPFTNALDPVRIRLQGVALYDFFFYVLQTDKHMGSLCSFEPLLTGYGVKAIFSWNVDKLYASCIAEMRPREGELTDMEGTKRSGRWIQHADKPDKTTPALLKLLHALALERCTVFPIKHELHLTAIA